MSNSKANMVFALPILACLLSPLAQVLNAQVALYDANGAEIAPFPEAERYGWTNLGGYGVEIFQTSETIGGVYRNYFRTDSTAASSGGATAVRAWQKEVSPSFFANPNGWTASAVLRVLFADDANAYVAFLRVENGAHTYAVNFINNEDFQGLGIQGEDVDVKRLDSTDISSDYVAVQMRYDPDSEAVTVYLDGVRQGTIPASATRSTTQTRVSFGKTTGIGKGHNIHWNRVSLTEGDAVVSEVSASQEVMGRPST